MPSRSNGRGRPPGSAARSFGRRSAGTCTIGSSGAPRSLLSVPSSSTVASSPAVTSPSAYEARPVAARRANGHLASAIPHGGAKYAPRTEIPYVIPEEEPRLALPTAHPHVVLTRRQPLTRVRCFEVGIAGSWQARNVAGVCAQNTSPECVRPPALKPHRRQTTRSAISDRVTTQPGELSGAVDGCFFPRCPVRPMLSMQCSRFQG
jgi:hypothetical protein